MATQTDRTFETRIDISADAREKLVELLNARLADSFDLYSQLKQAHWNVKGSDFIQLHELYDAVAESVLEFVDTIAERAAALGGLPLGTARVARQARRPGGRGADAGRVPDRCRCGRGDDRAGGGPARRLRRERSRGNRHGDRAG